MKPKNSCLTFYMSCLSAPFRRFRFRIGGSPWKVGMSGREPEDARAFARMPAFGLVILPVHPDSTQHAKVAGIICGYRIELFLLRSLSRQLEHAFSTRVGDDEAQHGDLGRCASFFPRITLHCPQTFFCLFVFFAPTRPFVPPNLLCSHAAKCQIEPSP